MGFINSREMKKTEAIKTLNATVETFFKEKGFKPYKCDTEIGWIKKNESDLIFIDFGYVRMIHPETGRRESYNINPSITISNNKIEEHYRRVTVNSSLKDPIEFRTVCVKVAVLENCKDGFFTKEHNNYDWEIDNENAIERIAPLLIDKIDTFGLPIYQKLKTVEQIDRVYNNLNTLDKPLIYPLLIPMRAIKGIIAAKIVNNNNLNYLISYYEKEISNWNEMYRKEFYNLKEYLNTI